MGRSVSPNTRGHNKLRLNGSACTEMLYCHEPGPPVVANGCALVQDRMATVGGTRQVRRDPLSRARPERIRTPNLLIPSQKRSISRSLAMSGQPHLTCTNRLTMSLPDAGTQPRRRRWEASSRCCWRRWCRWELCQRVDVVDRQLRRDSGVRQCERLIGRPVGVVRAGWHEYLSDDLAENPKANRQADWEVFDKAGQPAEALGCGLVQVVPDAVEDRTGCGAAGGVVTSAGGRISRVRKIPPRGFGLGELVRVDARAAGVGAAGNV